jgi:hypothetical protein
MADGMTTRHHWSPANVTPKHLKRLWVEGERTCEEVVGERLRAVDGLVALQTLNVGRVDKVALVGALECVGGVVREPVPERIERSGPVALGVCRPCAWSGSDDMQRLMSTSSSRMNRVSANLAI